MKQAWDIAVNNINDFKTHLEELLEMLPQGLKFSQKNAILVKAWKKIQHSLNELDKYITPVKSIEVKCVWLSDPKFRASWNIWKEYLNEQHGITMFSRAEVMALKRLMEISDNKIEVAISYLEYPMSRLEKNFYKINEFPENKKSQNTDTGKFILKLPDKYKKPQIEKSENTKN